MGLLPDTQIFGLLMHRECRERFSRHPLQRKSLVIDSDMHHGTCTWAKQVKWNLNEFWKQSKRILNKGQNELYDTITEDGTKLENPEEAKSHIRKYFRDLYQARPGKPEYEHWTEHIQQCWNQTKQWKSYQTQNQSPPMKSNNHSHN